MDLTYKKYIEVELKSFFESKKRIAKSLNRDIYDALCRLEEYTLRDAKRIRAMLVIIGYLSVKGRSNNQQHIKNQQNINDPHIKEIIKISCSIELLHSFFLIHDDIIDDDSIRRKKPSMHATFWNKYNKKISSGIAIVIGDFCCSYAFQVILDSKIEDKLKLNAIKELQNIFENTCYGELLDIYASIKNVNEEYIKKIHEYKTAKYTITGPLKLGAILAGADNTLLKKIDSFGSKLGLAFQLQDDILGIFGSERILGKPVGTDIAEGKTTLLTVMAKSNKLKKIIEKYRKKGNNINLNQKKQKRPLKRDLEEFRKIITESGSLEYSKLYIKKLFAESRKELMAMNITPTSKQFLLNLIQYLETRNK